MINQIEYYQSKLAYEMDPSDLKQALENNEKIIAIDTRKPNGFEKEHIPNAINIHHSRMSKSNTDHLDKSMVYVCYCDGIGCNASTKGALKMTQLGFKVRELIGGLEWWKLDGFNTNNSKTASDSETICSC